MKKVSGFIKRALALFTAAMLLAVSLAGCSGGKMDVQQARSGVVRVVMMARVQLYEADENGVPKGQPLITTDEPMLWCYGSGFAVGKAGEDPDTFVTNRHVVEDGAASMVALPMDDGSYACMVPVRTGIYLLMDDYSYDSANGLDTSRAVPCSVIYEADADQPDIAVLKAAEPVKDRVALPIFTGEVKQGDQVWALGFPGTSDDATSEDYYRDIKKLPSGLDSITVTNGVASKVADIDSMQTLQVNAKCIQTTAQINHGNSGGPLMNDWGAVVGINTYGYEDLFYAVSVDELGPVLESNGIDFDVTSGGFELPLIPIAIAGGVVLLAVVIVLVVLKTRKPVAQPAPPPNPEPGPVIGDQGQAQKPPAPPAPATAGGPRIQGEAGYFARRRFSIDGTVRLGRDPGRNDLVFPAGTQGVSGVHCQITRNGDRLFLMDLGSTYGTFLGGGQRLAANESVELHIGDRFYLGSEQQMFRVDTKGGV